MRVCASLVLFVTILPAALLLSGCAQAPAKSDCDASSYCDRSDSIHGLVQADIWARIRLGEDPVAPFLVDAASASSEIFMILLEARAAHGDLHAQTHLGRLLVENQNTVDEGISWLWLASSNGFPEAMYELGRFGLRRSGLDSSSRCLLVAAAALGSHAALLTVAEMPSMYQEYLHFLPQGWQSLADYPYRANRQQMMQPGPAQQIVLGPELERQQISAATEINKSFNNPTRRRSLSLECSIQE